jgi:wingless-type MMTV integration site family protein 8
MSFVHAISTAGVMYTLTKNCSMGHFEKCSCDNKKVGQKGKERIQLVSFYDNKAFLETILKCMAKPYEP